jgi:hypothetical protein
MFPMHKPQLELNAHSIVLIGAFNPAIFHPQWFGRQGLLPAGEAENAALQVVHPQMSQFETERFYIQVTQDRFTAVTKPNTSGEPLRDLVYATFVILEHTPVTAMGMNRQMHFAMGSEDAWHRLGDKLAPKEPWSPLLPHRPGLRTLEIHSSSKDPKESSMTVKVQPSVLVTHGAYFEINSHHPGSSMDSGRSEALQILKNEWDSAQEKGETIARDVLEWSAA